MSRENHIKKLIANHSRRLEKLKENQALLGINCPPEILIEIEDIEQVLSRLNAEIELAQTFTSEDDEKLDLDIKRDYDCLVSQFKRLLVETLKKKRDEDSISLIPQDSELEKLSLSELMLIASGPSVEISIELRFAFLKLPSYYDLPAQDSLDWKKVRVRQDLEHIAQVLKKYIPN